MPPLDECTDPAHVRITAMEFVQRLKNSIIKTKEFIIAVFLHSKVDHSPFDEEITVAKDVNSYETFR